MICDNTESNPNVLGISWTKKVIHVFKIGNDETCIPEWLAREKMKRWK